MPTHPEASFVEFGHLVKPITTKEVRHCLKGSQVHQDLMASIGHKQYLHSAT